MTRPRHRMPPLEFASGVLDLELLLEDDPREGVRHAIYRRAQHAIMALTSEVTGHGCLTPAGARYLGIIHRSGRP